MKHDKRIALRVKESSLEKIIKSGISISDFVRDAIEEKLKIAKCPCCKRKFEKE